MTIVITELRPIVALDIANPACLACGAPMAPDNLLNCPNPDCGAAYLSDGLPNSETWPWQFDEIATPNPVPTLVTSTNGIYMDWCDEHQVYEDDHPLGRRSCRYYAAEARELRRVLNRYLSAPPHPADETYWQMRERMRHNPHFRRN